MRAPAFWWQPGAMRRLLYPAAAIYGLIAGMRLGASGSRVGLPVICLGNLTIGGAGKTPAALAVARLLLAARERPFFLSRGYGGRLRGPLRVNPALHRAAEVGDEPLLLSRLAPTIVARDRVAGARFAQSAGASVIVMDDGFQNPALVKDLAILVVDGRRGIGNGCVLPAGPLRAPLAPQLKRAQALIVIGPCEGAKSVLDQARRNGLPIFHGRLEPDRAVVDAIGGHKVLAFAGIADPDKFFTTLRESSITVAQQFSFADHHRYSAAEAHDLAARAQAENLMLVTTEKDLTRLGGEPGLAPLAEKTNALPVRLVVEEEDQFRRLILDAVGPER